MPSIPTKTGTTRAPNALTGNGVDTIGFADSLLVDSGFADLLGDYGSESDASTSQNGDDLADATSEAHDAFEDASQDDPVTDAANTTVGDTQTVGSLSVPRGTVAFIGAGAGIKAGRHVDLDARERLDVTMVGGGLGVGGLGIGAGIAILVPDEQVRAFVGTGASVEAALADPAGDVLIDARLKSDLSVLAVTAGFGGVAGLAAAVVVVNDSSDVSADIADASSSAAAASIGRADTVNLTADRDVATHVATLGAAGGGFASLGAAVVVVEQSGDAVAEVGDHARIGSPTRSVGGLSIDATNRATVGPFEGFSTTVVGLAVSFGGSGAAGVGVVTIDGDTEATIGNDVAIDASGAVAIDAESALTADIEADGGASARWRSGR